MNYENKTPLELVTITAQQLYEYAALNVLKDNYRRICHDYLKQIKELKSENADLEIKIEELNKTKYALIKELTKAQNELRQHQGN